jgi:hypothetical protein
MSFVDLPTFKRYMSVNRGTDLADDTVLQLALDSAEILISEMTGRTIVLTDNLSATRYFPARGVAVIDIDDAVTITAVTDTSVLVDPLDYQLYRSRTDVPYTQIIRPGSWADTLLQSTVGVTGVWGWASIPAPIKQACLILAKDIASNQNVSFGIAAFTDYGMRAKDNPQVEMLLAPYDRRLWFA